MQTSLSFAHSKQICYKNCENTLYGLIMHFCDSNHEITRSSKRKYNNIKITSWVYSDEKRKNKKFHISQLSNRVLTCWITKGWRKTTLVKLSASPAANTNQNLIEDVLQVVIKVTKSVKSTSGEISIKISSANLKLNLIGQCFEVSKLVWICIVNFVLVNICS